MVSLKETMQNILYKSFATKQDYALAMNNPTNWFNSDNKWYGFMVIGTILAVLFIPVIIFVLVKFFGLKFQFDKTSVTITKLLTMVKLIPPVKAECYQDVSDWQILEIIFKIVLFSVLIYVSYKFVKFVMSYVNINNLAEIQSNFSFPTTLLLDKTDLYLDLQLCHVCQIPLTTKFFLRRLFQNHRTMYRLIACQTSSRKVLVILPLCDLYDHGTEVNVISELTPTSEVEVIEEGIEDPAEIFRNISEQTYATVHGMEVNGMSELELNEIMTN